jgi:para-nitrobenzyl esterase
MATADGTFTVETTRGAVQGRAHPGGAAFLGIPYAEPPRGLRQFLAPVVREKWDGVRPATTFGPTPQRRGFADVTTVPERSVPGDDVLSVNVFTPAAGDTSARLPVMVWIHGGGYFAGSPASPWFDGASFARDGVVLVSLSYRLGFDGFGHVPGTPLNRGLLDQIAALEWVQENVSRFGGDPDAVTMFGQSAGGGSVLALLRSPRAVPLFRAAVVQSGALPRHTPDVAEQAARRYADELGIAHDLDSWRSVGVQRIVDTERDVDGLPGLIWTPVVDGDVLLDAEPVAKPVLAGTTAHELGVGVANQLTSISLFREPLLRWGRGRAGQTWTYDFRYRSDATGAAGHCHEIPFVFDLLGAEGVPAALGEEPPQSLADTVHRIWTGFAAVPRCDWPELSDGCGALVLDADGAHHDPDAYLVESLLLDRS